MEEHDGHITTHLTPRLAASLRAWVRSGEHSPGHLFPSERELAERFAVSRTTVRRAVKMLVDERLLYRVPGSGTFVGQPAAKESPATLGLVVPSLANPYYGELSEAIEGAANARGYQLLVGQSQYTSADEARYLLRYAESPDVKGVLVTPSGEDPALAAYRYLMERETPFIFTGRVAPAVDADAVTADLARGARELVRYLIELGHRRIAYIGASRPRPDLNLEGYRLALRDAGIPEDPSLIPALDADNESVGRLGVRALREQGTAFTAIFARIDMTAATVLQALRAAGLRVPEDVSLVGFDNTHLSAHLQPPLTTVDTSLQELGRLAVALLLDRVEGRYVGPPRHLLLRPQIIPRASSARWSGDREPAFAVRQEGVIESVQG
ncbi:MAG: GntR family transcriptional regulator [Thermomicrobiales bacterium]